jgi:hypothetical protein
VDADDATPFKHLLRVVEQRRADAAVILAVDEGGMAVRTDGTSSSDGRPPVASSRSDGRTASR